MNFLERVLSDDSNLSCMRLMSLLSLVIGAALAIYTLYAGRDPSVATSLVGVFVGAAFTGKAVQSFAENGKDK